MTDLMVQTLETWQWMIGEREIVLFPEPATLSTPSSKQPPLHPLLPCKQREKRKGKEKQRNKGSGLYITRKEEGIYFRCS
jgi:hypothetical protein